MKVKTLKFRTMDIDNELARLKDVRHHLEKAMRPDDIIASDEYWEIAPIFEKVKQKIFKLETFIDIVGEYDYLFEEGEEEEFEFEEDEDEGLFEKIDLDWLWDDEDEG